jgi:hypothetical protein
MNYYELKMPSEHVVMLLREPPIAVLFCIDYRFDALATEYLNKIGLGRHYYNITAAGASLLIGRDQYCKEICSGQCDSTNDRINDVLLRSIFANLDITKLLSGTSRVYIINHQDCGAFKNFLSCSNYPDIPTRSQDEKDLEISINQRILMYSKNIIKSRYPSLQVNIGIIDMNGTVADFSDGAWILRFHGDGDDPKALWYNQYF